MPRSPVDLTPFAAMLRSALGGLLDPGAETFIDQMAEDAVMEFPFAPPGGVRRVEGRAALSDYLADLGEVLTLDGVSPPRVLRTDEEGTVVLEFSATGRGVRTGLPYRQDYVSIVTVRGGRIVRYRDYWNPMAAAEALGFGGKA